MRRTPTYYQDLIDIVAPNSGHIIATTACLGGFLPTKLLEFRQNQNPQLYSNIKNWLSQIEMIFGKGNFYLEMQPSPDEDQIYVNKRIIELSKELDIPYIITTDAHYLKKEDAPIHKAFLNSQDGEREVESFYKTTYVMTTEELESYINSYLSEEEIQEAYKNILDIKNKCEDYSLKKSLKIPSLIWKEPLSTLSEVEEYYSKIPYLKTFMESEFNGDRIMAKLIVDKLNSDNRLQEDRIYNELNENLKTTWISSEVNQAHWSAYFLNLQKTIEECWNAGTLVGPGRGSGVGFLLLYIMDIIQINPLWETTKTFAWRFLNPDRVSVLDVDTDIEGGRRSKVLQHLRDFYGEDRVANVVTFGTEGSKSAVQTAARGLGIDVDVALYISSLIPSDRGKVRTLKQCYYGDKENGFAPIPLFVQQMEEYPEIWQVAQKIEGLVCRVGEHAGGVIFVDEPFSESTALMRVPNGDIVTQFDLHDSEKVSLIKVDLLSVEALDKMHNCLDLLCEYNYIERQPTLKETYEKYIGVYNLERNNPEMWKLVHENKIQSLFQMNKQSGIQGIALTKPTSVDDLAVLNSVIRLMAQEKGEETPLEKYTRFKNNIKNWYKEMDKYGLTKEEQHLLERIIGQSYGIAESQEKIMQLVQLPECGGFNLSWADSLRKAVAKKQPEAYLKLEKEYFDTVAEKHLSKNLCYYVWKVLIAMSRGYSFNLSHTLAYSIVGLQEMNLAFRFPIIFWNCACLIVDSGGIEEGNTDYKKIAVAIGQTVSENIKVALPDINTSNYTFTPDPENNQIFFGLSGILNVGEDVIQEIIRNRPYISIKDFCNRVSANKQAMISLIKSGAFDNLEGNRKMIMAWYIWQTCDKKKRLTLQNLNGLMQKDLIPKEEEYELPKRVYEFNRYLKAICKIDQNTYQADERAIAFLEEIEQENLISSDLTIAAKPWDKVYQTYMDVFRNWIKANHDVILQKLNDLIFKEDWVKYALGSLSSWEMEVLCFYFHEHELQNVNKMKYGLIDFNQLPEIAPIDRTFQKGGKTINLYKIYKICGTCIAKNKDKSSISLLTTSGVVEVKFRKEHFAIFDKQISKRQPDGSKKVIERSWFNRGNLLIIQGIRNGDSFTAKKYASTPGHTLYKITEVKSNGDLGLKDEREKGDEDNG